MCSCIGNPKKQTNKQTNDRPAVFSSTANKEFFRPNLFFDSHLIQ